jgi:hypothetical protein
MRLQFVRNYLFIFDSNDGRGREETGQIELSDDDEAFAFWRTGDPGDAAGQQPAI